MYRVIDNQTKQYATKTIYKTLRAACRAANRLDLAYGAYRYQSIRIEA